MKRAIVLLVAICCLGQQASAAEPAKPPELKVLERFVGIWDCEIITKAAVWTPDEKREKAVEVNEMALDGWFLHGCSKTRDGKTIAVLMNTYDPAKKKYRIWRFAGRSCEELIGSWDEKTSTMTITAEAGHGIATKAEFRIIDQDHREYRVLAKDGDGKVYLVHPTQARADGNRYVISGCAAGFFEAWSGGQWDSRKRPLVKRTIRGLDAPLAHRSLDVLCQVASPQSLTPFLQTGPLYPSWRAVGKYHWTPDLCLENPWAKAGAFLSRMNRISGH
jgi:hypothetical protein